MPLLLDMPGLFFVEAAQRIERGKVRLAELQVELKSHRVRVETARQIPRLSRAENAWIDVIHGVGGIEPLFGATISEFAVAYVLLVAAAES